MKEFRYIIHIACALLTLACCTSNVDLQDLKFDCTEIQLAESDASYAIPLTIIPEDASDVQLIWSSSNPEVASVTEEGVVTPVSEGCAKITVSSGSISATCQVTVSRKGAEDTHAAVNVSGIRIPCTELKLAEGQSGSLDVTVVPENADESTIYYKSGNPDIATVDSTGKVRAVTEGEAVITAITAQGGFTAYCLVSVHHIPVPVTGIRIKDGPEVMIDEGQEIVLTAFVTPEDADNQDFVWSISDKSTASVDQSGKLTARKPGETVVYAISAEGMMTDSCKVTVRHIPVAVTGIKMIDDEIIICEGDVYGAVASIEPLNADNSNIIWSTADPGIATVDSAGLVTALSAGHTLLKAVSEDGGFEGECSISVEKAAEGLQKVSIEPENMELQVGETIYPNIVFTPESATNKSYSIWSDNEQLVRSNTDGSITACKTGRATITIKTADGCQMASCLINVIPKTIHVTNISLDKSDISLLEGESARLTATVLPADASNPAVVFESSDSSVASVGTDGLISAHTAGQASITATTVDGSLKASAIVNVTALYIPLTAMALDSSSVTLHYPESKKLNVVLTPSNATIKALEWSSDASETVEVDSDGNILAKGIGEAVITVACEGFDARCTVKVLNTIISTVQIGSGEDISVESGSTYELSATVLPENASDKSLIWSSSDTSLATVDANGLVTFGKFAEAQQVTISAESAATPGVVGKQLFHINPAEPDIVVNGSKSIFNVTTGNLADALPENRIYKLKFGKVKLNAADIQTIRDRAQKTLNSIDLSNAEFVVDETQFTGYAINTNIHKVSITGETEVPDYMFYEFSSLKKAILPECTTKIGARVFSDSAIDTIVLPPNTKSIGQGAFISCPVSSITFNDGLETIGDNLFHNDNIEEIILPESVKSIGSDSFIGMTKLKRFRFGSNATATLNPLSGCTSLTEIEVAEGSSKLMIVDSCLVSKSKVLFLTYPIGLSAGRTDVTVGTGATRLASYSCNYLANTGCVTVAEGITTIMNAMQFGTFTSVDLPSTLQYISHNAFMSSTVKTVKLHAATPPIVSGGSLMLPAVNSIYVPDEALDDYKASDYWKQFGSKLKGY